MSNQQNPQRIQMYVFLLSQWGGCCTCSKCSRSNRKTLRVSVAYFEGTLIIIKPGQEINVSVRLLGPHTGNLMNIKQLFLLFFKFSLLVHESRKHQQPGHVGGRVLGCRCRVRDEHSPDAITPANLQYADSIIIKKIGWIPEERGPNGK